MRKLMKILFSRVVGVSLSLLLQIGVVVVGVTLLDDYYRWISAFFTVCSWVAVILIMSDRSNPSYKVAWIVLILAFPVAGIPIYLMLGGSRLPNHDSRRLNRLRAKAREQLSQDENALLALKEAGQAGYNHARYLMKASYYPVYQNSTADFLPTGEAAFADMLRSLEKAEHYIFLEYFIIEPGQMWDTILEILERKARQGVDVRVLYDDFGCITRLPRKYPKELAEKGIKAYRFNPYVPVVSGRLNNRDHRKLMLIDGLIGYTGGINLADEYINVPGSPNLNHWKDCAIRIEGEAVWSMVVMFLTMWGYASRQEEELNAFRPLYPADAMGSGWVQPYADMPLDHDDVGATAYQQMISCARERVWIMTPYLILDDKLTSALCVAAKTGVDVRIVTPGTPDKWYVHAVTRANYEVLTEAGVRIYEYQPGFIHSKVCLTDHEYAIVGTLNMDFRSLYLHFENAVYLCRNEAVEQVDADFRDLFPECREITYARCRHVHLYQWLVRTLLRVFSPLM